MVSFLVFHIFVTSLTIKHDIIYYDLLMIFVNEYFNMNRISLINGIKNRLKQDYFNADKITKKILTDLFEKYGKYFEEYLTKLLNNKYSFTLSTEEYFKYVDLFIEIKKYLKNNNNFLSYFSKIYKMNPTLINYQADDLKTFFKDNNLTELQANVLISRIKGVLLDKTNFNKNDIYDLFYLYSYSEESLKSFNKNCHTNFKINNIILLSFDKNLMKSIHKISNKSEEIINSYKI